MKRIGIRGWEGSTIASFNSFEDETWGRIWSRLMKGLIVLTFNSFEDETLGIFDEKKIKAELTFNSFEDETYLWATRGPNTNPFQFL